MKVLKEDIKKKNKKSALPFINKNAGNVEYNISMFNKMSSPIEGPSTNPISGSSGENAGGEGMGESIINDPVRQKSTDPLTKLNSLESYKGVSKVPYELAIQYKSVLNEFPVGIVLKLKIDAGEEIYTKTDSDFWKYYRAPWKDTRVIHVFDLARWFAGRKYISRSPIEYWQRETQERQPMKEKETHLSESTEKETVDLDYTGMYIDVCTRRGNPTGYYNTSIGGWLPDDDDTCTVKINYTYTVDKNDVLEFLADMCIEHEFTEKQIKDHDDDWDEFVDTYVNDHFNELMEKYHNQLLDYFYEDAYDQAEEENYNSYYDESLKSTRCNERLDKDKNIEVNNAFSNKATSSDVDTKIFKVQYLEFPNPRRDNYNFITTTIEADSKEDAYQKMRKFFNQNKVYYRDLLIYLK